MDELSLLVTQIRPSGATAMLRGARPTVTSLSFARVMVSKMLTLSLSWFTTHSRGLPPPFGAMARLDEDVGLFAVSGRYTVWVMVSTRCWPESSFANTVT
jgi:hypothetical protein